VGTVRATQTVGLTHPSHGGVVVVSEGDAREDTDPLVVRYPWAFGVDNVERATAAPGERRPVGRPRGSKNRAKAD
jgi:hypothetical protein